MTGSGAGLPPIPATVGCRRGPAVLRAVETPREGGRARLRSGVEAALVSPGELGGS